MDLLWHHRRIVNVLLMLLLLQMMIVFHCHTPSENRVSVYKVPPPPSPVHWIVHPSYFVCNIEMAGIVVVDDHLQVQLQLQFQQLHPQYGVP